jgi:hypothetical protein
MKLTLWNVEKGKTMRKMYNRRNKPSPSYATYKRTKTGPKDYQNSNHDNQTDNKDINGDIEMSMGLGEEGENKSKTKTMDQRKDKSSMPKEAASTTATISSPLSPTQSEVFDSSSDNAMSEMKQKEIWGQMRQIRY